jgi:hypothetical protein
MTNELLHKVGYRALAGASLLAILVSSTAFADDAAPGMAAQGAGIEGSTRPTALSGSGPHPEGGIPIEGWMLYPSLFVGGVFSDNVYQTETHRVAATGLRLAPNIEADLDTGLHKTTLYANADAQLYPGYNSNLGQTASTISGRAGLAHMWSPTSDVVVRLSLDYTRQDGPFGSTLATSTPISSATSFVGAPSALNVAGYRQFTDQTTANLSVQKNLTDQTFVRIGGGLQDIVYERPPIGFGSALSGIDYNAFARVGFWVTPLFNAFVEAGDDFRRYHGTSFYDTDAYRVVAGLSSDMIGLFRGEAYGGLQQQFSTQHVFGALTAPAFGGRITYYPTQYLTIAASVDDSFGSAGGLGAGPALTANSTTLQARLQADYAMFEYWRASARGGFADTHYAGSPLFTDAWLAGAGVSYSFWRNFALTLDYQFTRVNSTGIGSLSYSDNLMSAGVTYHY